MARVSRLRRAVVAAAAAAAASAAPGCGDNERPPPADLVEKLSVAPVATLSTDDVLALALAPIDAGSVVVARATSRGGMFCDACLEQPAQCPAVCRRAVIDVAVRRVSGPPDPGRVVAEVYPPTPAHFVTAVEATMLELPRVGVAWLQCDLAPCRAGVPRQRCTAHYATIDLLDGLTEPAAELYADRYGDLQLAYDRTSRRLLAVVGKREPSRVGVRAAIFDRTGGRQLEPWRPLGGASARAPAVTATPGGFVVAADDPDPERAGAADACSEACDCAEPGPPPPLESGGVYAYYPGSQQPPERVVPGRGLDGAYRPREAIAAIDSGGRPVIATSQAEDRSAELFEPVIGGWIRRHASKAPLPRWLGALGDDDHLAWIGSEPSDDDPAQQQLVAGVVSGEVEERGPLLATEPSPGLVLDAAPARSDTGVKALFVLRGVPTPDTALPPRWLRFEVVVVRADW